MRGPNPQEVFFANSGGQSMNPFLKSERAETYQLGVTSMFHGLLSERDTLRTKALFYRSRIADYISSQAFNVCKGGRKCTLDEFWSNSSDDYNDGMTIYTNSPTPVRTRGFELEADYDAGFVYARLSYSREHTSQPTSFASGMFAAGNVSELPDEYYTLDLGAAGWSASWKWAPCSSATAPTAGCRRTSCRMTIPAPISRKSRRPIR